MNKLLSDVVDLCRLSYRLELISLQGSYIDKVFISFIHAESMKLVVELYAEKASEDLARLLKEENSPLKYKGRSSTGMIYSVKSDDKVKLHLSEIFTDNNRRMALLTESQLGFYPESVLLYRAEMDKHTMKDSLALGEVLKYLLGKNESLLALRYIPMMEDEDPEDSRRTLSTGRAAIIGYNFSERIPFAAEEFHWGR